MKKLNEEKPSWMSKELKDMITISKRAAAASSSSARAAAADAADDAAADADADAAEDKLDSIINLLKESE